MADNASDKPDPQEAGTVPSDEGMTRTSVPLPDTTADAPFGFAAQVQRTLSSGWHKAKVSLLAQFPVMGPHGNEVSEAELLLSGKKPLGWITVVPDKADVFEPYARQKIAMEAKLDQAVKEGRLKAIDVVVSPPSQTVVRHYCQPGHETEMETVAAYNEKIWSRQTPDANALQKRFGDYLGYRKRDQMLADSLQKYSPYLPNDLVNAFFDFNRNYTQPALLEQMLGHPVERQATTFEGAMSGDSGKQYLLGKMYRYGGDGAPMDNVKAMEWFTRAAEGGLAVAQAEVGRHYATGDIVPRDGAAAAKWLTLAADQGMPAAMTSLGLLYEQGEGVERNDGKAMELFRRAAELGDTGAHAALGSRYAAGRGVPQDNVEAAVWYKLASRPNFGPPIGGDVLGKLTEDQASIVETRVADWEAAHGTPKSAFKAQLEAGTASVELPMKPKVPVNLAPGKNPPAPAADPFNGTIFSRENLQLLKTAAGIARSKDAQDMLMRNPEGLLGSLDSVGKLRLVSALATLSKTPEGKHLVEQLEGSGAQVKTAVSKADGGGLFLPDIRVASDGSVITYPSAVTVPGATSQESLLILLAHELQHLDQAQTRNLSPFASGKIPGPDDILLRNRFIEADADATVVEIAYKLKQQGSPEMWNGIAEGGFRRTMAEAFEKAITTNPAALDNGHAKRAAFDTWFTAEFSPGYRIADHYNEGGLQFWPEKGFADFMLARGARTEPFTEEDYKPLGQQKSGVNYLDLPDTLPLNDPFYSRANYTPEQQQILERQRAAHESLKNPPAAEPAPQPAEEKMRPPPMKVPKTQDMVPPDAPKSDTQRLADLYIKAIAIGKSLPENVRIAANTPSALVTGVPFVQNLRKERALKVIGGIPEGAELVAAAPNSNLPISLDPNPMARGARVGTAMSGPQAGFTTSAQSLTLQGYSTEGTLIVQMAHELQHVRQMNAGLWSFEGKLRSPRDILVRERFLEADAEATATEVAFKLRQAGKPGAWNALQSTLTMAPEISTAYEKMASWDPASVADGRAKRAAFDAWFEAKRQGSNVEPLTNHYNKQAMKNYPPESSLRQMKDAGAKPEPPTPEDFKKVGSLSGVNYLDIPGGKPLDDPYYNEARFTLAAARKFWALTETFNKAAAPERAETVTLQHDTSEANLKTSNDRLPEATRKIGALWRKEPVTDLPWKRVENLEQAGLPDLSDAGHTRPSWVTAEFEGKTIYAVAKPLNKDNYALSAELDRNSTGHETPVIDKIAFDIAYDAGVPVAPAALWKNEQGEKFVLSLKPFDQVETLDDIMKTRHWTGKDMALVDHLPEVSSASVFHLFAGQNDDRGRNLVFDAKNPGSTAVFIDYDMAFQKETADFGRSRTPGLADFFNAPPKEWTNSDDILRAVDMKAVDATTRRIGSLDPGHLAEIVNRIPDDFLQQEQKVRVTDYLKHASETFPDRVQARFGGVFADERWPSVVVPSTRDELPADLLKAMPELEVSSRLVNIHPVSGTPLTAPPSPAPASQGTPVTVNGATAQNTPVNNSPPQNPPVPPPPPTADNSEIKVAPAPVKPPEAGGGAASKFMPAKTGVAPEVRKTGIGGAGAGAVGLVMSAQGLDQAFRTGDKMEIGIAGVNLATSTMQTTEGLLTAVGKGLPLIKGAAKFVPGVNIAVTAVDGVYQVSKENTRQHKVERGVVVAASAATGIGLGVATATAAEAGVITAGVTAAFGTGALATGAAAVAVVAAPVVLTVAAVATVAYVGNKAIETKRSWEAVENSMAEAAKPQRREGYKSEDGKPSILGYKHIAVEMLRVSGDMKDENMNGKPARDKNGRILIDEIRKMDMHDPKNVAELERALDLNIKKQQEIMKANDSLIVPRWMRSSASADKYTMAQMELGGLTGARAELDMYRKDLQASNAAQPDAPAATAAAAAPVRKQGPKLSS